MTKAHFKFTDVPSRNEDRIQRYSVLYPLYGICENDAEIKKATIKLLYKWRQRQEELYTHGWLRYLSVASKEYMLNCRPTFALSTPSTRVCRKLLICPFCYARWVRELYLKLYPKIETAFSGGHHIIERQHTFYRALVPENNTQGITPRQSLTVLLKSVTDQRGGLIDLVDPAGALFYTTAVYATSREEWKITHRQLFKVNAWQEFPDRIVAVTDGRLVRHSSMTPYQILQLIARTFRYPAELLNGDASHTVDVLEARAAINFRGLMCYRGFRNRAS